MIDVLLAAAASIAATPTAATVLPKEMTCRAVTAQTSVIRFGVVSSGSAAMVPVGDPGWTIGKADMKFLGQSRKRHVEYWSVEDGKTTWGFEFYLTDANGIDSAVPFQVYSSMNTEARTILMVGYCDPVKPRSVPPAAKSDLTAFEIKNFVGATVESVRCVILTRDNRRTSVQLSHTPNPTQSGVLDLSMQPTERTVWLEKSLTLTRVDTPINDPNLKEIELNVFRKGPRGFERNYIDVYRGFTSRVINFAALNWDGVSDVYAKYRNGDAVGHCGLRALAPLVTQ
jgi:hypothetical protein